MEQLAAFAATHPFVTGVSASLLAGLVLTSLGAAPVYVLGSLRETTQNAMLAFAAGVMLAATFFSLLLPALDRAEAGLGSRGLAAGGVIVALLIGALVMHLAHHLAPHEHFGPKGRENADLTISIAVMNAWNRMAISFRQGPPA